MTPSGCRPIPASCIDIHRWAVTDSRANICRTCAATPLGRTAHLVTYKGGDMIRDKMMVVMAIGTVTGLGLFSVNAKADGGTAAVTDQRTDQQRGGDMASRVKQALHSDPSVLDRHIDVSMSDGKVIMSGFVMTAEDLRRAVRLADDTAGKENVVNKLTIKEGGGGAG